MGVLDGLLPASLRYVSRELELQQEGSEVVAERVVELAGDAQALGGSGAVREQLSGRQELRVEPRELEPRVGLARREPGRTKGEELEADVSDGGEDADAGDRSARDVDDGHGGRLDKDPGEPGAFADEERRLS